MRSRPGSRPPARSGARSRVLAQQHGGALEPDAREVLAEGRAADLREDPPELPPLWVALMLALLTLSLSGLCVALPERGKL